VSTEVSISERQARALERLADEAVQRNALHAEAIELQRQHLQHLQFVRESQARQEELQEELGRRIISDIAAADPGLLVQGGDVKLVAESNGDEPEHGSPDQRAGPERPRGPWFVLRDPSTAPSGWINQVKVTHATRQAAAEEADRMVRKHGGRFLLLETTSYVEPAAPTFHEGAPPSGLDDLPF
jgi:hypothetical protein